MLCIEYVLCLYVLVVVNILECMYVNVQVSNVNNTTIVRVDEYVKV